MKKWILGLLTLWFSANAMAFPITLEHKYGTLTLQNKPTRIVSVGYSDQDDVLSFGVKPLAVRDWYGNQPYGIWPWAQAQLGDHKPVVLKPRILDYEAIAALKPDLIVGVSSVMSAKEYKKLNAIAPTLAQPKEYADYTIPWYVRHLIIGKALGFEQQAEKNIKTLKQKLIDIKTTHPEFKNKTTAVAFYYNKQPGAYVSKDLRSQFLINLGFVIPKEIDDLAGDAFYASFSEERLDLLNVDVLIWLDKKERIENSSNPIFRKRMAFYKQKREYFTGGLVGGAFSFFNYLSISYLLDEMIPELAKIAEKE